MIKDRLYTNPYFWFVLAIVVFLVNQIPFLVDMRPVMYDEGWYGNTAYNLCQGRGFLNSVVGTRGNSNFLLPLMTAGFMLLFGYNLLAIRLTAVFCGLITLVFLFLSMQQMRVKWKAQALVLLFFDCAIIYNTIFRFGRPECAAIMCVAGGLWFYLRYRESWSWKDMLGMSVFAGLAGCAHPYALLSFALIGVSLLIKALCGKHWQKVAQLLLLVVAAVVSVVAVAYVSKVYNGAGENYVNERFSAKGIFKAVPVYFKEAFLSKTALSLLPMLAVVVYEIWKDAANRTLAIVAAAHFMVFPFLFSTDLMMVGIGLDYFVFMATLLVAPMLEQLMQRKWLVTVFCVYCLGVLGLSYYYNYVVKYEKANSVLSAELQTVIPKGAKVFGPIRQWPMLMETDYQSDHTCHPILPIGDYDFVVVNSQDEQIYGAYRCLLPVDEDVMALVYEKNTLQYGVVKVYKKKAL